MPWDLGVSSITITISQVKLHLHDKQFWLNSNQAAPGEGTLSPVYQLNMSNSRFVATVLVLSKRVIWQTYVQRFFVFFCVFLNVCTVKNIKAYAVFFAKICLSHLVCILFNKIILLNSCKCNIPITSPVTLLYHTCNTYVPSL